jgi:hypothetical protein
VISDFVSELSQAAFKLGVTKDVHVMDLWADSWLKTPGCAEIELEFKINDYGKFEYLYLNQTPYN